MNPKLIIADEVSSNLDSTTKQQVMAILSERNHQENMAIILITHDLKLVRQWCKRIEVMKKGKIVDSLSKKQVLKGNTHHPLTRELLHAILEVK